MGCISCESKNKKAGFTNEKLEKVKAIGTSQAKTQNIDCIAIFKTVNANPGFMWRPKGHPDCERLEVIEWVTIT